jgi:hypothetical protein
LENAKGKDIFKALQYTKYNRIEKLPTIKYKKGEETINALSFKEKSEAFLNTLFPKPPSSDPPNWEDYISDKKWTWPKIESKEIKEAIFNSSSKTAPGPDQISNKIIQETYLIIPDLFYKLYSKLIEKGYHPIEWREAIGIILKKQNKPDDSNPKAYRIISLLNCLGKTAEKIIANRLGYLAETTDLLYSEQIGGRSQKSAIDAAMAIIHDIQLAKTEGLKSSCLFLDIKGAFDHVSINQLLGFCQRLKLPISLCNWI